MAKVVNISYIEIKTTDEVGPLCTMYFPTRAGSQSRHTSLIQRKRQERTTATVSKKAGADH